MSSKEKKSKQNRTSIHLNLCESQIALFMVIADDNSVRGDLDGSKIGSRKVNANSNSKVCIFGALFLGESLIFNCDSRRIR